jgi:hypothetical protein
MIRVLLGGDSPKFTSKMVTDDRLITIDNEPK